jgi:hypothetical protein
LAAAAHNRSPNDGRIAPSVTGSDAISARVTGFSGKSRMQGAHAAAGRDVSCAMISVSVNAQ